MKEKVKNKIQVQKFSVVFLPPVYPSKTVTAFRKLINPKLQFTMFFPQWITKKVCSIFLKVYHIPTKQGSLKATVIIAFQYLKPHIISDRIIESLSPTNIPKIIGINFYLTKLVSVYPPFPQNSTDPRKVETGLWIFNYDYFSPL